MRISNPAEIGALIRSLRSDRGWTQHQLAQQIGASARWLREVEHGKDTAAIGMVLRALAALNVTLHVDLPGVTEKSSTGSDAHPDIDAILDDHSR